MGRFNFNPQKLVVYHQKDEHDMISLDGSWISSASARVFSTFLSSIDGSWHMTNKCLAILKIIPERKWNLEHPINILSEKWGWKKGIPKHQRNPSHCSPSIYQVNLWRIDFDPYSNLLSWKNWLKENHMIISSWNIIKSRINKSACKVVPPSYGFFLYSHSKYRYIYHKP